MSKNPHIRIEVHSNSISKGNLQQVIKVWNETLAEEVKASLAAEAPNSVAVLLEGKCDLEKVQILFLSIITQFLPEAPEGIAEKLRAEKARLGL